MLINWLVTASVSSPASGSHHLPQQSQAAGCPSKAHRALVHHNDFENATAGDMGKVRLLWQGEHQAEQITQFTKTQTGTAWPIHPRPHCSSHAPQEGCDWMELCETSPLAPSCDARMEEPSTENRRWLPLSLGWKTAKRDKAPSSMGTARKDSQRLSRKLTPTKMVLTVYKRPLNYHLCSRTKYQTSLERDRQAKKPS